MSRIVGAYEPLCIVWVVEDVDHVINPGDFQAGGYYPHGWGKRVRDRVVRHKV